MRPFHHARASAARRGGDWREDLAIHEFLDLTKGAWPDLRHRMILHNADLGPELAARAFPDRADARDVARAHAIEDIGEARTLAGWIALCAPERLPRPRRNAPAFDALVADEAARQKAPEADARAVLDLLLLPTQFAGEAALCVLMNAIGPVVARRVLGPARERDGRVFDPAWAAEAMIHRLYGGVPELRAVVTALRVGAEAAP